MEKAEMPGVKSEKSLISTSFEIWIDKVDPE